MTEATLITDDERPLLRFERFLPRPIRDVWRAVTDPDEMRTWFPTRIEIERWEPGATLTHHFDGQALARHGRNHLRPDRAARRCEGRPQRGRLGGLPRAARHRDG